MGTGLGTLSLTRAMRGRSPRCELKWEMSVIITGQETKIENDFEHPVRVKYSISRLLPNINSHVNTLLEKDTKEQ